MLLKGSLSNKKRYIQDLKLVLAKESRIVRYQMTDWNGGDGKWGVVANLTDHSRLKKLSFRGAMGLRLGFTMDEKFKIFERAGWICEKCGSEYNLHADHIKPKSKYPGLAHDWKNNGRSLCVKCHAGRDDPEGALVHKFNTLLQRSAEIQMRRPRVTRETNTWKMYRRMMEE